MYHKSCQPVKSTAAAEILAVAGPIEEGNNLRDTLCDPICKPLYITKLSDSEVLYI